MAKQWLCLNPVKLRVCGEDVKILPDKCVALLAVYRTKKDARAVHGNDAVLVEADWEAKNA